MPKVSVIIPAYNGATRYLREAIESVRNQTMQDFELIIVDDASQDDTSKCIPNSHNIHYFRKAVNEGQASARNTGASMAQGDYVAFLDQDDLWEPNFLEVTLQVFNDFPKTGLVHTDGFQIDEQNHILEYDSAMKSTKSICQLLRFGHDTATSGSLIRKVLFDRIEGFDSRLTIWEDIDFGIRFAQSFSLYHLPTPLYRHRLYNHNASRGIPSGSALLARKLFLEKHAPLCPPNTFLDHALSRDWAQYFSDSGKYHLARNEGSQARHSFFLALKYYPYSAKTILRYLRSCIPLFYKPMP